MYLPTEVRARHIAVFGATGTGKSSWMQSMIYDDIQRGDGVGVIDPHGSLATAVMGYIPHWRRRDVVYLNAEDRERPVHFNPLSDISKGHSVATDNILSAFIHVFGEDAIGPRTQQVLRNSIRVLLETEDASLLHVPKLLTDKTYRTSVLRNASDPFVKSYWHDQFDRYTDRFREEVVSPILNKLDAFLSSPEVRNIISRPSTFDLNAVLDGQILVANLSKAELGEQNSHLLGALLVSSIGQAAFQKADDKPFYLYVDEFQNFATSSFSTILSEARKYGLSLTIANQFLDQLPEQLKGAVFGNVGTVVCFRVGATDAQAVAPMFGLHAPVLVNDKLSETACEIGIHTPQHLSSLPNYRARVRVFPNASVEENFPPPPATKSPKTPIQESRNQFGREKSKVEQLTRAFLSAK